MKDKHRFPLIFYFSVCFLFLGLQAMQLISIHASSPDFMLILTIIFSLFLGSFRGELIAFTLGVLLDVMSGGLFGQNAFFFTLAAACSGLFRRAVKMPSIIVFYLYLILTTCFKYLCYVLFNYLVYKTNLLDISFLLKIPGEILFNIFVGTFVYVLFARIDSRENYEWF